MAMLSELLPIPTTQLIQNACQRFDSDNKLVEKALEQLKQQFPENTEVSHVLLKVLVLNKLYNTRINDVDVPRLAMHIVDLGVDEPIKQGDPSVVWSMFMCDGLRKYYSFATKFCSWHNPESYPIYDGYAEECLWAYRKRPANQEGFAQFRRQDCWYYDKYKKVVSAFRTHYKLDHFTFKEIDKFLWQTGERIKMQKRQLK